MRGSILKIVIVLSMMLTSIILPSEMRAQADSTISTIDTTVTTPPKQPLRQQLLIGIDVSKIAFNFAKSQMQNYDFQAAYNRGDKNYYIAEAGLGTGNIDYAFLKYSSQGGFLRLGIDRSLLGSQGKRDYDIAFVGFRYGLALGRISEAWYQVSSPFGGAYEGTYDAESFFSHWGELTAGMKLEVWPKIFLGWTGRAKFLFNGNRFQHVAPNNIAGYGAAEKSTAFDFNLYLSYAIFRK